MSNRTDLHLSVVVPLYDEVNNVSPLTDWILESLADYEGQFEVLLVDDGSSDGTWEAIRRAAAVEGVRGIRLGRNVGQTAAMMAGFDQSRGRVVVSLDGDLQNDPRDISALVEKLEEGHDLVCGWRRRRQDRALLRRLPSWCANHIIRWLTGVPIRDNGCSLKAYRRDLLDRLALYADQHRFIPALAASYGARIVELPVRHHPRRSGRSKYGLSRTGKVLIDLATLKMVTAFRLRPLAAFGAAAFVLFVIALLFLSGWFVAVIAFTQAKAESLVFPGASLLLAGAGFYLLMLGLLGEVALRSNLGRAGDAPFVKEL